MSGDYSINSRVRQLDKKLKEMESHFWKVFVDADTPKAFCQGWLPLQCLMLEGVRCALVLIGTPDTGPFSPLAVWPDARISMSHLAKTAEQSIKERRGLLLEDSESDKSSDKTSQIAYPIELSGKIYGVVVAELENSRGMDIQSAMRRLHWGAAWLELMIRRNENIELSEVNDQLQKVIDVLTSSVEHEGFDETSIAAVTRMSTIMQCDRVSLGFLKGRNVKVRTLSHSADFSKQTNIVRAIGSVMDEAIDQQSVIVFPVPPDSASLVAREHEILSSKYGAGSILTIPLLVGERIFGALTFERSADLPFSEKDIVICKSMAALAGPVIETKRSDDRLLIRKIWDTVITQTKRMLGPGYLIRKAAAIALLCLIVFFSVFKIEYRVTAQTNLEGSIQRVIAAPFNGFIKESPVRPGDVIKKGKTMCLLDDRDLNLERIKWTTEKKQLENQYNEAIAKHDRAQRRILNAKIEQADAQIALLDEQLGRVKIIAPFDSVVISGDLSQSLGLPVERGQVLFEVAPLDRFRVIAQVDERDIREIKVGQESELVLPSMPGKTFPFIIKNLTLVTTSKEGRNFYRVEGEIQEPTTYLRPGMEGISKISIDRRRLIWVWTHKAIDWLRLKIWRWLP